MRPRLLLPDSFNSDNFAALKDLITRLINQPIN